MHKVIVNFFDLQDNNYAYKAGDIFPREGVTVSEKRLEALKGTNNRRKVALIEEVKESKKVVEKPVEKSEVKEEVEFMNLPVESVENTEDEVKEIKTTRRKKK